jgi:sugar O-acyltransferase (sialic acid O-acetyltransferase NeuD family)
VAKVALLLIGGGGHARSVIDVIEAHQGYQIAGVVEANPAIELVGGYQVLGQDPDLPGLVKKTPHCLITLGQIDSGQIRQILFEKALQLGAQFPVLVSPLAYVSPHARIGAGSVVMHHALVNSGASVGRNAIVNSKALVEHDAVIGDHTHVATGAIVNGEVQIGHGCLIGSGAVIKQGVQIANNVIIGAGARIIRDIASPGCYVDMGRELNQVEGL